MRRVIVFGDWGTSRLRLTLCAEERVLAEVEGPGIGALEAEPGETLLKTLAPWRAEYGVDQVVLCGMAGSVAGVVEAPYVDCPASAADWVQQAVTLTLDGLRVRISAGLATSAPNGAPDVMRGEEAQIFGAIALRPELAQGEQWFVLPGTHSKWCKVQDGRVVAFQTFITGELFALLTQRSSLLLGSTRTLGVDDNVAGYSEGLARAGETLTFAALFEARSGQLRAGRSAAWAKGYLSGLLIGSEVVEAKRFSNANSVIVIGAASLAERYRACLLAASIGVETLSAEASALTGLRLLT